MLTVPPLAPLTNRKYIHKSTINKFLTAKKLNRQLKSIKKFFFFFIFITAD